MESERINIDFNRFKETLDSSSEIGKVRETGLYRLALSNEDKEIRELFVDWMKDDGLEVRVDDVGNIYGRRGGNENVSPVLIGSHLDTQPYGGRYDGVIGVLLALEVIRTLNEHNIKTRRPIEIVNFTNEEGARFEPPMMASGLLAGAFDQDFIYSRADIDGVEFGEELARIGYKGEGSNRVKNIHSFIEVHIEQGPRLEEKDSDIGVVKGIQGVSWYEINIQGKSNHAGSTPMHIRKDPLMISSRLITEMEDKAIEKSVLLTVGKIQTSPGAANVIPENVKFSLDIRSEDNDTREAFIELIKEKIEEISSSVEVTIDLNHTWTSPTVEFNEKVIEVIEDKTNELGYGMQEMVSGAGHDARYISDIAPTAMIFAPSIGGISHDVAELTLDQHLEKCGILLLEVVRELAEREDIPFNLEG